MEKVADILRSQNYNVAQLDQNVLLARPKRTFFRLNHLGLYWFQIELQPSLNNLNLEFKMSLIPWGILFAVVILWQILSYRMPIAMKCVVFLVLIPDILTLLLTFKKYSNIETVLR